jgi:AmmeMemoRadiSam system protein B
VEADSNDVWETPLGKVDLDKEYIELLGLPVSNQAQRREHSAEVMLPFLQHWLDYPIKIVPVCILRQNPQTAREVAGKIHVSNAKLGRRLLIIASSDFSHYVEPALGKKLDDLVLEEVRNLDSDRLYENVLENNISVCGYGPIMTLIEYAKLAVPEPKSTILARGNSGKSHPSSSVVDYVSILFYE